MAAKGDDADSAAAHILANFASKSVVLQATPGSPQSPVPHGSPVRDSPLTQRLIEAGLPGSPTTASGPAGGAEQLLRTPQQSLVLPLADVGTPSSALRRSQVKKRGPVSKLDGAYFPHKLFRIIASSNYLRWLDEVNFQIVSYEGLLNEWRELVNDIKEQTMKDELRKHNFIRNRKMEKERGGQGGEIWYHRESLFQQGKEHLLDEIKRKYRSAKKIKPVDEGPDLMAVTSSASDMQIPGNVASVEAPPSTQPTTSSLSSYLV